MRISDWSSDVFFRSPRRRCRRPAARTTADRGPAALGIGAPHPYFGIPAPSTAKDAVMTRDTAIFAGGCFWCTEAVFQSLAGVDLIESAYRGAPLPNPTYTNVCGGDPCLPEATRITYAPPAFPFNHLLNVLFRRPPPPNPHPK